MGQFFGNFKKYRFFLGELVKKEIKLKYRSSVLGLFWTLLEPLLTMLVLTLVFSNLFARSIPFFSVYVLIGRLVYSYFSNGTKNALKSIRQNSSMIRKVYVPKYMYPLSGTIASYITYLISLVVLVGVAIVMKVPLTWHMLEAVYPLLIIFILTTGVGLIMAVFDVFFRDTEYLWSVLLMLIMYMSAIFYDATSILSKSYGWIIQYNPIYVIIKSFRNAVFGQPQEISGLLYVSGFALCTVGVGLFLFYRTQDKFVLHI